MKILVIDDDHDLRAMVAFALRNGGFFVVEAGDGQEALRLHAAERPALVVLDLNLPGGDGFALLPRLRAHDRLEPAAVGRAAPVAVPVPVLVLSVRSSEEDVVRALDLGADDYLTKPFSPRTLLARVRALLRRAGDPRPQPIVHGDLQLDLERHAVAVAGRPPVRLTPLELRLLQFLMARAGETVAPERLLLHVWGARGADDRQLLKQLVHRLRQKLEPDPAAPRYLVTAANAGYRLDV